MKLEFKYTNQLVNYLIKIENYRASLEYLYLPTRAKQEMMYKAKLKKTHFSTSIEGNVLSLNQVEKVVNNKDDRNRLSAEQEVINYWDALSFLEDEYKKKTPVTIEFILRLHDIIQKKVRISKISFRGQNEPGVLFAVYDSISKLPEYIPPEWIDIEPLMNYLIYWYNKSESLPVPVRAAIFAYGLVSIHPFEDGNGRTSRAMATYILMLNNYDFKGFNSFEEYYMSDLEGYYSSIQMGLPSLFYDGRENPPHLEIWIEYFCKIMALNAEKIYEQAKEANEKSVNTALAGLSKKDIILIRYCIENQIKVLKNKDLAVLFSVTPRAISKWMVDWVNRGIMIPLAGKERITSYKMNAKYSDLKVSDIGFID